MRNLPKKTWKLTTSNQWLILLRDSKLGTCSLTIYSVRQTTYKLFVPAAIRKNQKKKHKKEMQIDKKIDTEMGVVHFKGEITPEEQEYLITMSLVAMFLQGQIDAKIVTSDGTLVADIPDTLQ